MDLNKNGKLLCDLRRAKGMTQKEVADKLGVVPKTVSKFLLKLVKQIIISVPIEA